MQDEKAAPEPKPSSQQRRRMRLEREVNGLGLGTDGRAANGISSVELLENNDVVVAFSGPLDTEYAGTVYRLKICTGESYPFVRPEAFFIGEAPRSPFYHWDADDGGRAKRTTNLANTDFGIFYESWHPSKGVADFVARIRHSLTREGYAEMREYMSERPL